MKRVIAIILAATALTAHAGYHGHHGYHHHARGGSGWGWVVPAIIGGTVVYMATRPAQAEPQPVIVQPPAGQPAYTCPPGTMMFYEKRLVGPDYNGRYVEGLVPVCR